MKFCKNICFAWISHTSAKTLFSRIYVICIEKNTIEISSSIEMDFYRFFQTALPLSLSLFFWGYRIRGNILNCHLFYQFKRKRRFSCKISSLLKIISQYFFKLHLLNGYIDWVSKYLNARTTFLSRAAWVRKELQELAITKTQTYKSSKRSIPSDSQIQYNFFTATYKRACVSNFKWSYYFYFVIKSN